MQGPKELYFKDKENIYFTSYRVLTNNVRPPHRIAKCFTSNPENNLQELIVRGGCGEMVEIVGSKGCQLGLSGQPKYK